MYKLFVLVGCTEGLGTQVIEFDSIEAAEIALKRLKAYGDSVSRTWVHVTRLYNAS